MLVGSQIYSYDACMCHFSTKDNFGKIVLNAEFCVRGFMSDIIQIHMKSPHYEIVVFSCEIGWFWDNGPKLQQNCVKKLVKHLF